MNKPADTDYPVHELIRNRWSPRAFDDRPVEREKLLSVLEAARWAPSCYNEQPWRFLVATKEDPTEFARMLQCLVEFNRSWAKAAPVLLVSVASLQFGRNGKDNRHAYHDVGLATENLKLQARALGLATHAMAGFDVDKTRETYGIPESHDPVAAIALGYPGDADRLEGELREREMEPRERNPLADFVFTGSWGATSAFVAK